MYSIAFITVTLSFVFLLLVAQISVQYFHTSNRHPNSSLRTNNEFDRLLQENGYFVLFEANEKLTSGNSRSSVPDGVSLTLETNGNLAVYNGPTLLWETGKKDDFGDYFLSLQSGDGNFIVRHGTTTNKGPVLWKTQKLVSQKDDFFFALSSDLKKVSVNQGVPSNVIKELWSMDTLPTSLPLPTQIQTPGPTPGPKQDPPPITNTLFLAGGQPLFAGEHIALQSYNVQLKQELDGNLKLCKGMHGVCDETLWESGYRGSSGHKYMTKCQLDGHFLTRDLTLNSVVWRSKVVDSSGDYFVGFVPSTREIAVYKGVYGQIIGIIWTSGTSSPTTLNPTPHPLIQQTRPPSNVPTNQPTSPPTTRSTESPTPNPTPASVSHFNISLMNMGKPTKFDSLFDAAKRRWESIIINDLPDMSAQSGGFDWFDGYFKEKSFNGAVDDVVIGYAVDYIDGPGSILGSAGPRYVRTSTRTTISGIMKFDKDDFAEMGDESAMIIILHEMGHVLGLVGSLGGCNSQCDRNQSSNKGSPYSCEKAKAEYAKMNITGKGQDDLLLNRQGGTGSRCAHWDDTSFQHDSASELMTAFFVKEKRQLITRATLGALEDISSNGYKCDYSRADRFPSNNDDKVLANSDMIYSLVPDANFTIEDRMESVGEPELVDEI